MSLKAALIAAAAVLLVLSGYWVRGLQCTEHVQAQVIVNQGRQLQRTTADSQIVSNEGENYAKAVAAAIAAPDPAPAVVCVRRYTLPVGPAAAARSGTDGTARLPAGADRPVQPAAAGATDIGAPAALLGARANAQVAGLQDYILRVCLAK